MAECQYVDAVCCNFIVLQSVILPNVIIANVVMPNVVAPKRRLPEIF